MPSTFPIISPVNGELLTERAYAEPARVEEALHQASLAFRGWKSTSLDERADLCRGLVSYFLSKADEWGLLLTRQMGRPIRYAPNEIKGGFAERAEYMIRAAEQGLTDIRVEEQKGFRRFIRKEPLGIVLVLAPWNYPYLTSVNAVIPALLAGNPVILKHATQTALCAEHYAEAARAAGFPGGIFQFLHLDHGQVARVIRDPRIAHLAFTGSVEGGQAVQQALSSRFIGGGLELGGKDPAYVAHDADLAHAIPNLVDGAFFNSGQSCCGIERIYVQKELFDDFVHGFELETGNYILGDPANHDTTLGPMVRVSNARNVLAQIEQAVQAGAKKRIDRAAFPDLDLPYLPPQVLVDVDHDMTIMREETFGPAVGIMPVENEAEAIRLMNDSRYGLTASIWTNDPERAMRVGGEVETGTWFMNRCDYLDPALAWTGVKDSGRGCTLSVLGYDQLTRPKSFHLKLNTP